MYETNESPNEKAIVEDDGSYELYGHEGSFESPDEAMEAADVGPTCDCGHGIGHHSEGMCDMDECGCGVYEPAPMEMSYVDRLAVKLGRAFIPPHGAVGPNGKPYKVKGYWRRIRGAGDTYGAGKPSGTNRSISTPDVPERKGMKSSLDQGIPSKQGVSVGSRADREAIIGKPKNAEPGFPPPKGYVAPPRKARQHSRVGAMESSAVRTEYDNRLGTLRLDFKTKTGEERIKFEPAHLEAMAALKFGEHTTVSVDGKDVQVKRASKADLKYDGDVLYVGDVGKVYKVAFDRESIAETPDDFGQGSKAKGVKPFRDVPARDDFKGPRVGGGMLSKEQSAAEVSDLLEYGNDVEMDDQGDVDGFGFAGWEESDAPEARPDEIYAFDQFDRVSVYRATGPDGTPGWMAERVGVETGKERIRPTKTKWFKTGEEAIDALRDRDV